MILVVIMVAIWICHAGWILFLYWRSRVNLTVSAKNIARRAVVGSLVCLPLIVMDCFLLTSVVEHIYHETSRAEKYLVWMINEIPHFPELVQLTAALCFFTSWW